MCVEVIRDLEKQEIHEVCVKKYLRERTMDRRCPVCRLTSSR